MSEPDGRRGGGSGPLADGVSGSADGVPGPADGVPGPADGVPGPADGERQLRGVEQDLELLAELDTQDQVPVYDRMHAGLADALARTADTGADPGAAPAQGHRGP